MSILTPIHYVDLVNGTLNNNLTIKTISSSTIITSAMPVSARLLTLTCMIFIDISVFFGNLLVICAFFRTRRLQTVTNYFIASLAFADALVAIFVLPLSIYYHQRDHSWQLGLILCDLWVSSDVLLCTSSILNLTCISVDRYMAITRPLTYTAYRSKFLARIMILLVWITSVVITCPPIFGWRDSNRKYTVERDHKCDLNTARGYVVYSALGSFYIPAFIMIFVYIRIFMVVYDRENLMQKFYNNNNNNNRNRTIQTSPSKTNQNGLINIKNTSNGANDTNNKDLKKRREKSYCCCLCFRKRFQQNDASINHQRSLSPFNNNCLNTEQKPNGSLIYRFTSNNNMNMNTSNYYDCSNSTPNTPPLTSKVTTAGTLFCRPCTISTRKITHLSKENYYRRRKYMSHIGAQYQFRTCDSPCYELKNIQNSLPSLIRCRSHSFDRASIRSKNDLNVEKKQNRSFKTSTIYSSTNFTDKTQNEVDNILLSNKENNSCSMECVYQITQSLNELTHDRTQLSSNEQIKLQEIKYPKRLSKCTSLIEQKPTNNSRDPNFHEHRTLPEQTRINRRTKPTRRRTNVPQMTKSIENLPQQHRIAPNNNSSLQSNQSSVSIHRKNVNKMDNSKRSCCYCYSCLTPLNNSKENKNKKIYYCTPNHSLTYDDDYDDDYDDKLSSNDANNRAAMMVTSNASLRVVENLNHNTLLSSNRHHQSSGNTQNPSHDVHRRERIRFMKEQKTAKTLAVVVGGFILFWLPFFIMYVIPPEIYSFSPQTGTLITWLGYFNSVINPFIYAYCSKQFRMAFWNITFGICIKKSKSISITSVKTQQVTRQHTNR
ncbi:unnamed protein product [Rotaria socialis]|uniref:G-protein coupled receptors family 1 profile domain-containing protein n=1 Tax=Rotaria socialis TaxID=392032 RepID=A0A820BJY7_9BILA|nr:unnamed protein product [Rotaria socialis]CAF4202772.1 unnamed protein product [Rotaria socialis]